MKVQMIQITANETKPFGSKREHKPVLFSTEEAALRHIGNTFPSASEITDRLRTEAHWRHDIPRTWFVEIPEYDNRGDWDYSTEYTITLEEIDVK